MQVILEESDECREGQVLIRCHSITPQILRAVEILKTPETLIAYKNATIYSIHPDDVFYFETVDSKTFLYTETEVYEFHSRLQDVETAWEGQFVRVSRFVLLNWKKIKSLRSLLYAKLEAQLYNGENIIISRKYVGDLKRKFGI